MYLTYKLNSVSQSVLRMSYGKATAWGPHLFCLVIFREVSQDSILKVFFSCLLTKWLSQHWCSILLCFLSLRLRWCLARRSWGCAVDLCLESLVYFLVMVVVVFQHSDPYWRTLRTLFLKSLILIWRQRPVDQQMDLGIVKALQALLILVLISWS